MRVGLDLIGAPEPAPQQRGGQGCDKRYYQGRNISFKSKTSYRYFLVFGIQMQSFPHLQEQRQKLGIGIGIGIGNLGLTEIIKQV